jgi:hypothetical protein
MAIMYNLAPPFGSYMFYFFENFILFFLVCLPRILDGFNRRFQEEPPIK